MGICYDESSPRTGGFGSVANMNPHKAWERHLHNWYYLDFIARSSDRFSEKQQAEKELNTALRKMAFWERHPEFLKSEAERMIAEQKRKWKSDRRPPK